MIITHQDMKVQLNFICKNLKLNIVPKKFQIDFFCRAVAGANGFIRAPCGMGKSILYQLLPHVLQKFRFLSVEFPVVVVIQPLVAISEGQVAQQLVPSCMLSEGGKFPMMEKDEGLKQFSVESLDKLTTFMGVLYSSPEVWDGKYGMAFKLHFSGRIISLVVDEADKINQWGPDFRDGYTRLGLLKPFLAETSNIFLLTATATAEDMKVACDILTIEDDLQMNLCIYRGEHIKVINRPNSSYGWEGVFKTCDGELKYEPGLRQLLLDEYLEDFFGNISSYPRTVILFRDQSHLALTSDILSRRIGYSPPEQSDWIQFHSLVDQCTLKEVLRRFADPAACYKLILMTTKGLCGTHIVDVERTVMLRPLSSPHDLMQLSGRGGRGPTINNSSLEIIYNNSDLSLNVPGMSADVRRVLDPMGCIPEKLCSIFGYKFTRKDSNCCSNCDVKL